jgi:predicted CxxxxCH...CXXCH cytochrome family protein
MRNQRLTLLVALAGALALAACGDARPVVGEEGEGGRCATCHGFPPPPGVVTGAEQHPQSTECATCHPDTVNDNNELLPGGAHLNNNVDVVGGHAPGFRDASVHGRVANQGAIGSCTLCHGADYGGGIAQSCSGCHRGSGFADWQTNCTFCHGAKMQAYAGDLPRAAPPQSVTGATANTDAAVGAHQKHLGNGTQYANGFTCDTCHVVPSDLGHIDGTPAELTFHARASGNGVTASYNGGTCTVYCHQPVAGEPGTDSTPAWSTPPQTLCGSCHPLPPGSGSHRLSPHLAADCGRCHAGYVRGTTANKATHVNGVKDVVLPTGQRINGWDCVACHTALGV